MNLKSTLLGISILTFGAISAQTTSGDITQQSNVTLGNDGGAVRLVDNKGTIKYLQAANGLTSFTNTTPAGGVITTWQLGGTLTDDTYITAAADGSAEFALNGLELVTDVTSATTNDDSDLDRSTNGGTTTGFTVLIRDEATGAIQKIKLAELLQVNGIRVEQEQAANASADVAITVSGLPTLAAGTTAAKLFVYRNGVKLRFGTDFSVAADTVTINYDAADLPMYAGDFIEVQYIQ